LGLLCLAWFNAKNEASLGMWIVSVLDLIQYLIKTIFITNETTLNQVIQILIRPQPLNRTPSNSVYPDNDYEQCYSERKEKNQPAEQRCPLNI